MYAADDRNSIEDIQIKIVEEDNNNKLGDTHKGLLLNPAS